MPRPQKQNLPIVSIIVLNYNGKKWLKACFDSVRKLNYPRNKYEVIMGDNASTDDSVEYVKKNYPWIKIVRFDKNYGFCKSNNDCAKQAKGEYIAFLNNDTYVDKDWLIEMVKGILSEKEVVSVACKMLFPYSRFKKRLINTAGGFFSIDGPGPYNGFMEEDSEKYNQRKYTGFGCGAGVLVERKFFIFTGGFDEYYFYSVEEMDLGFRVWAYGKKVLYVPSAVMYHYSGGTGFRGRGLTPTIKFLIIRNKLYFILKNFEAINVIKSILFEFSKTLALFYYLLFYKKIIIFQAIVLGYISFFRDIKQTLVIRRLMQGKRKINDKQIRATENIIGFFEFIKQNLFLEKRMKENFGGVYDSEDNVTVKADKKILTFTSTQPTK